MLKALHLPEWPSLGKEAQHALLVNQKAVVERQRRCADSWDLMAVSFEFMELSRYATIHHYTTPYLISPRYMKFPIDLNTTHPWSSYVPCESRAHHQQHHNHALPNTAPPARRHWTAPPSLPPPPPHLPANPPAPNPPRGPPNPRLRPAARLRSPHGTPLRPRTPRYFPPSTPPYLPPTNPPPPP